MKKFRKRNKGESFEQYFEFLIINFWPFIILAQLILPGISSWLCWSLYSDIRIILVIIFITICIIILLILFVVGYRYNLKKLIFILDPYRSSDIIIIYNTLLVIALIAGILEL